MNKLLSTLITAAFASATFSAFAANAPVAVETPKAEAAKPVKKELKTHSKESMKHEKKKEKAETKKPEIKEEMKK